MASPVTTEQPPPPAYPDYMLDPDAVLKDNVEWRQSKSPDYSKTRKFYAEGKTSTHAPDSLASLVSNLVKNWEIEATHKPRLSDWRTIDPSVYTFSVNGGPPQSAAHMLTVGTYSAVIASNAYYGTEHMDLRESHEVFGKVMPSFAWEVIEVYSGPPVCVFRWRHWGIMTGDYVGFNDKGQRVTIQSHNQPLEVQGVTVAKLNADFQITTLETWFDPLELFHQMRPSEATMTVVEVVKGEEKSVKIADTTAKIKVDGDEVIVKVADGESAGGENMNGHGSVKSSDGVACPFGFQTVSEDSTS